MLRINFNLRNREHKNTRIIMVARWSSNTVKLPTTLQVAPDDWDSTKQKIKYNSSSKNKMMNENGVTSANNLLSKYERKLRSLYTEFVDKNDREPSVIELREAFRSGDGDQVTKVSFYDWAEDWIEKAKVKPSKRVNGAFVSPRTIKKYKTVLNRVRAYEHEKSKPISFNTLDAEFMDEYRSWMTQQGLKINTVVKDVKVIRKWMKESHLQGKHDNRSYLSDSFKASEIPTVNIYLSVDELKAVEQVELKTDSLRNVRDWFIISSWTALRYGDLEPNRTLLNQAKGEYINTVQSKTAKTVTIPLLDPVKRILKKHDYKLPKMVSNQKYNDYIKLVCKEAEINEIVAYQTAKGIEFIEKWNLVTAHTARRSCATNLHLLEIPNLSIMKITGHRTESEFMKYIGIKPVETAIDTAKKLDGRL